MLETFGVCHTQGFYRHTVINPLLERAKPTFLSVIHDGDMTDRKLTKPLSLLRI